MRYTNSLHYNDGALKGRQWPRLAPIFILFILKLILLTLGGFFTVLAFLQYQLAAFFGDDKRL